MSALINSMNLKMNQGRVPGSKDRLKTQTIKEPSLIYISIFISRLISMTEKNEKNRKLISPIISTLAYLQSRF